MRRHNLSTILFIWLLLSVMTPTVILSGLYLSSFKSSFLRQQEESLSQFADRKVKQIESYIDERIADAFSLSQSVEIVQALEEFNRLYGHEQQAERYRELSAGFRARYQHYQDYGYLDILLVSPAGELLFSLGGNGDVVESLNADAEFDSGQNFVVQRAKYFLESSLSGFEYSPAIEQTAAYIGSPVLLQGRLIGIVVLQFDSHIIQKVASDVSGLRSSREVVVAARQGDSFSYQVKSKYNSGVTIGQPQPVSALSEPLSKALSGHRYIGFDRDYRGVEVLAASRYIPSVQWGLVFKEDKSEVMQVYEQLFRLGLLTLGIVLIGVLLVSGLLGRVMAKPFESMSQMTRSIASGETGSRMKPEGFRESYELALCFNQMSHALTLARETLEQQVEERTLKLTDEIELRQNKEAALAESYKRLNLSMKNLQAMQSQLIESEKMAALGGLVAGFAHELNTPIGVAITASSLLLRELTILEESYSSDELTEDVFKRYLNDIKAACSLLDKNLKRSASLVKDFKLVAVEQTNLHKEKFVLHELIESLLSSLSPETRKYPVAISNRVDKEIVVHSYAGDFYQVLTNLILNSLLHGFSGYPNGELVIDASIKQQSLIMTVADNGKGISSQDCSNIFEPFFTTKRGQGGSGLGLSIVYNIVKQKLRGNIDVSSDLGQGTKFTITCPVED
ncbi:ATP-binding protein [uncultured Shewanella sp.]|uniref:sensor histidine kinase n=1 Tax=uncultured Shewanella sp. TaxID=173975 RepID=UPI0026130D13|nr:ATP-binding protein [uncultured Shewanella sp.]